jgi:pantothenate kinase
LFLDQTRTRLKLERTQVERFYYPLATRLLAGYEAAPRTIVAVAGPPGSGKTAFAAILVGVLNAEAEAEVTALVGLDGWHYPNYYLKTHFHHRGAGRVSLRAIKGAPESFDARAAYEGLAHIRREEQVTFPVYSRQLHEPVPAGGTVEPWHQIVVAEGNYLLLDEDPWRRFLELFDLRVFISASPEILVANLQERHRRGGKTPETIERHMREVDLPNARRVAPSMAHAHLVVHKADGRRIDRIEWRMDL